MEYWGKNNATAARSLAAFSFPWWALGLAGVFVLLLVVWMGPLESPSSSPTLSSSVRSLENRSDSSVPATDTAAPVRVSVLDLVGKLSLVILLGYGVVFVLRRWLPNKRVRGESASHYELGGRELRLQDALTLPSGDGQLYLVEVRGHALLIGAAAEQLTVLWSGAEENTSALPPVNGAFSAAQSRSSASPVLRPAAEDTRPMRNVMLRDERDWAQQRRRLINALMESEAE